MLLVAIAGCNGTKADERFEAGLLPGTATLATGVELSISPGRAKWIDGVVAVRAASPTPELSLSHAGEARFRLTNVSPYSTLSPRPSSSEVVGPTSLEVTYEVPADGLRIRVEPPGAGPVRLAVISDLHDSPETWRRFSVAVRAWMPDLVLCMGDLTNRGGRDEFYAVFDRFGDPEAPIYTTLGNHDLMGEADRLFEEELGPSSVWFDLRGVRVVLADTAGATFAPAAYPWLAEALQPRPLGPALVLTHIPPMEPWGMRSHSFSNRDDAMHFIQVLSEGNTTHLFAGHIHSYAEYSIRGIPTTISGGGNGGTMEGGIDHHWLKVVVDPALPTPVAVSRVSLEDE